MAGSSQDIVEPSTATRKADPPPKKRRRRRRILAIIVLTPVVLALVASFVVTRSTVLRRIFEPRVSAALGIDASCRKLSVTLDGKLVATDLKFRTTEDTGPARELLVADRVVADIGWGRLLSALNGGTQGLPVASFKIDKPIVRLSQNAQTGRFNVATLFAAISDQGGSNPTPASARRLPEISITDGTLSFGEHNDNQYTELVGLHVRGILHAPDTGREIYAVELEQLETGRTQSARLVGGIDLERGAAWLDLTNIELADWGTSAPGVRGKQFWKHMALDGEIPRATFRYEPDTGVAAEFELVDVDLVIPVPAEEQQSDRPMSMSNVSGTIRIDDRGLHADLIGAVEDFPARVRLDTKRAEWDSPLTCQINTESFVLKDHPQLLPFAPESVREFFKKFTSPTAIIAGELVLTRGEPTGSIPAPVEASGVITIKQGRASYHEYPYPITNLAGTITFDTNRVEIVRLVGDGPTGARMHTTGWASTETSGPLDIVIDVTGIPLDDELDLALQPKQGAILTDLCNADAFERVLETGSVLTKTLRTELEQQRAQMIQERQALIGREGVALRRVELKRATAAIDERLAVPGFHLGGIADVRVRLHRSDDPVVHADVDGTIQDLGIVPKSFAYPIFIHGFALHVDRDNLRITTESISTPTGGAGTCSGSADLSTGSPAKLAIQGTLNNAPIDPALLAALQQTIAGVENDTETDVHLDELGLAGLLDADIMIESIAKESMRVVVSGLVKGVSINPIHDSSASNDAPPLVTNLSGEFLAGPNGVRIGPLTGAIAAGDLTLNINLDPISDQRATHPRFDVRAVCENVDIDQPIERLAAPFAPETAASIARLRAEHTPEGRASFIVSASGYADEPTVRAEIQSIPGIKIDIAGSRVAISSDSGKIIVTPDMAVFEQFTGTLIDESDSKAAFLSAGILGLTQKVRTDLSVTIQNAAIEGAFVQGLINARVNNQYAAIIKEAAPTGRCDADLHFTTSPGADPSMTAQGSITPHWLQFQSEGEQILFSKMTGRFTFAQTTGQFEHLGGDTENWSAYIDGNWATEPSPVLDIQLSANGKRIDSALLALLPSAVSDAFSDLSLTLEGGFDLKNAKLLITGEHDGAEAASSFEGLARFTGLNISPGVQLSDIAGEANILLTDADKGKGHITVKADTFSFAQVPITNTHATIRLHGDSLGYDIPDITADVIDGRLTGAVTISPNKNGSVAQLAFVDGEIGASLTPPPSVYHANFVFSGVNIHDLVSKFGTDAHDQGQSQQAGKLEGELSIAGVAGKPERTRGRGVLRVEGGTLAPLPLVTPVLELSHLQIPSGDALDFADAEFYIRGDQIIFNRLLAQSDSLVIAGDGAATLPDLNLDLRLRSSGRLRVPFVSDLIDALRSEIMTIAVTGSLTEPQFGVVQLPVTRQILETMFIPRPTKANPIQPQEQTGSGPGQ